ncbi:MAG: recombinase family protein [Eubacterium sp.]
MRTGALYIRVSTDDQTEYSPDAQIRLGLEYAEKNNIIISPEYIFQDDGISGRKAQNRPAFQEMISLAKSNEHPIDVIIVWKFSRFARNQEEAIVYKNLLKKSKVDVVSVSEPIPDGVIGDLVERIFEWMDEYYSINLGVEAKRGMTQKVLKGGYVAKAPYGYNHVKGATPTINSKQASIVKSIYHKFVYENLGTSSISRHLNNAGIKTSTGNTWSPKTIKYILQNPFYIGYIRWDYQPTDITGRHINNDYMRVKGSHESIIDEMVFNLAQNKFKLLTSTDSKHTYTETRRHWLSGMVKCSTCGGSLGYGSKGQNRKPIFRCVNYNKGRCNCSNGIVAHKLEKSVIDGLINAVATNSYHVVEKQQDISEINMIHEALQTLPIKEERIRLAYMDGIDTLDDYKFNRELLQREKNNLEKRLQELKKDKPKDVDLSEEIISAVQLLSNENVSYAKKTVALKAICQKIVYDKKSQTLDFYLFRE